MGYATTLYGVSLDALKAAVGSQDEQLKEKATAATCPEPPITFPTAVFLADGGIVWNDVPLSPEALRAELSKIEPGAGVKVRATDLRSGNFLDKAKISATLMPILQEAMVDCKIGLQWVASREESDELPLDDAISDLIQGKFRTKDEDHTDQYGYALEKICLALGQHLGTLEGELLLRHLKLKSPLSKKKKLVRLPTWSDVPEISFLTSNEVRAEDQRLRELDLSYAESSEIECGRREYAAIVATAAERQLAIVAFGY